MKFNYVLHPNEIKEQIYYIIMQLFYSCFISYFGQGTRIRTAYTDGQIQRDLVLVTKWLTQKYGLENDPVINV